jgi:3-hydroxyisobutyrate dehydrogenase-like beta-hydroxyacid dehydrogenase
MAKIAFMGLGAMGTRMAKHLLDDGHTLTVWNRTPERADALLIAGAHAAHTPADAADGADFVMAMVRDDEASRQVWFDGTSGAANVMRKAAIAIDCSTLSLDWSRKLAARFKQMGIAFLDAPVAGSRPQAEARQLISMVGGDALAFVRAAPVLRAYSGACWHTGRNGTGSALKLAVNALLGIQVAAVAELLAFLWTAGMEPTQVNEFIGAFPVFSPAAKAAASGMIAGAFAPMFPVELVEKDLGYALESSTQQTPLTRTACAVFKRAIDEGYGKDNLTAVYRLYAQTNG